MYLKSKHKIFTTTILFIFHLTALCQNDNFYILQKSNIAIDFSKSLGIVSLGYGNNGFYGTLGYAKYGYKNIALSLNAVSFNQFNNMELNAVSYGNSIGDVANMNMNILHAATFTLQWDILKFPDKFVNVNYPQVLPFNFVLSPYISVAAFEWTSASGLDYYKNLDDEHTVNTIATQSYLSSFETGLLVRSSIFNLSAGYAFRTGASQDYITSRYLNSNTGNYVADGYKNLDLSFSTLFVKIGVNIDWFFPSEIKKRQKIYLPLFQEPQNVVVHGSKGSVIYQNDVGSFDVPLKNIGAGEGKAISISLRPWGDYNGLQVTLTNSNVGDIKPGKTHILSPRIVASNVVPGPKNFDLILTGNDSHFRQEISITFNITAKPINDEPITRVHTYPPTVLDENIPQKKVQPNKKALIILIDRFDDPGIEPILVGDNVINTLSKYLRNTFGITDKLLRENLTIHQFSELFDPYEGIISDWVAENTELFIYILSHGVLVDDKQTGSPNAYILCQDNSPSSRTPGYSISKLVANLDELNIKDYTLLIDACYSGAEKGSLSPSILKRSGTLEPQNGVVITSSGDNKSYIMEDIGHTTFSYFFLQSVKKLGNQKSSRTITIEDIFNDLKDDKAGIANYTIKKFNKKQEPQIFGTKTIEMFYR